MINEIMKRLSELPNATLSDGQEYIQLYDAMETVKRALEQEPKIGHWIDNNNGTISCSHCRTWFNNDDRYYYMLYCPYCNIKMAESEPGEGNK